MITFRQKNFTEYDAMRSLYVEILKRTHGDPRKFPVIDTSALIPILKGNNVVVERFVITTSFFGKDRYRMYLKIGAKAKMPDEVRLPGRYYDERIGNLQLNMNSAAFVGGKNDGGGGNNKNNGSDNKNNGNIVDHGRSTNQNHQGGNSHQQDRGNNQGNNGGEQRRRNNNNRNPRQTNHSTFSENIIRTRLFSDKKGAPPSLSASFSPYFNITRSVKELLGDAVKYDKRSRSLVLEFDSIDKAIEALNILPFGLDYKIYLLNA